MEIAKLLDRQDAPLQQVFYLPKEHRESVKSKKETSQSSIFAYSPSNDSPPDTPLAGPSFKQEPYGSVFLPSRSRVEDDSFSTPRIQQTPKAQKTSGKPPDELEFITFVGSSRPGQGRNAQRLVRSHVMKQYKKNQREALKRQTQAPSIKIESVDPFRTLPAKTEAYMLEMVDYFAERIAPRHVPIPANGAGNLVSLHLMPLILGHAASYHAVIACSAIYIQLMDPDSKVLTARIGGNGPKMPINSLHRSLSKKALEQVLVEAPTSDSAIMALALLGGFETLNGNVKEFHEIMRAIKRAVEIRGGLHTLPGKGILQWFVNWVDVIGSGLSLSKAYFTVEGGIPNPARPPPPLIDMGPSQSPFQFIPKPRVMGDFLWWIFEDIRALTVEIDSIKPADIPPSRVSWFNEQRTSTEYRLVSFHGSETLPRDALPGYAEMQEACRIACLLYVYTALRTLASHSSTVISLTVGLRRILEQTDLQTGWELDKDLLLWVLFVGACRAVNKADRLWFISHLCFIVDYLGLRTSEEVNIALRRVVWHDKILGPLYTEVWKQVEAELYS